MIVHDGKTGQEKIQQTICHIIVYYINLYINKKNTEQMKIKRV